MKAEREQGGKRDMKVVMTGSVLSMMGFVGYSSYSPSKYAIRGSSVPPVSPVLPAQHANDVDSSGLAESLRNELLLYSISVHLFLPATIFSPGFKREQELKPEITKRLEGPDEGVTCEVAAAKLITGSFDLFAQTTF